MKFVVITLLAVMLCACVTPVRNWSRPGANTADISQDQAQCQYQSSGHGELPHHARCNDTTGGMGNAVGDGVVIAEKQIDLTNDWHASEDSTSDSEPRQSGPEADAALAARATVYPQSLRTGT